MSNPIHVDKLLTCTQLATIGIIYLQLQLFVPFYNSTKWTIKSVRVIIPTHMEQFPSQFYVQIFNKHKIGIDTETIETNFFIIMGLSIFQ